MNIKDYMYRLKVQYVEHDFVLANRDTEMLYMLIFIKQTVHISAANLQELIRL